ncbi:MAG: hypothetical protein AB7F78_25085 [Hyphomicrobiaceae bacterium]
MHGEQDTHPPSITDRFAAVINRLPVRHRGEFRARFEALAAGPQRDDWLTHNVPILENFLDGKLSDHTFWWFGPNDVDALD